jgi:sulfoxide reductase catalytic subunit YedY
MSNSSPWPTRSRCPASATILNWPYREGLRMDEANHPLTLLTLGMYGEVLPNQNGAPVRIIVPGSMASSRPSPSSRSASSRKSPRPPGTCMRRGYGFYSNVNPNVDHPRWSQATERRIGEDGFFAPKRKTLMFNGYNDVASLQRHGLRKFF